MHKQARYQSHGQHNYPSTRPRRSPGRVATIYRHIAQVSFEDHVGLCSASQTYQKHMLKRRAARTQKTVDGVLCVKNCKDLKTLQEMNPKNCGQNVTMRKLV